MNVRTDFSVCHLIAHCLASLETKFQFHDAFRHKMTAKILEHVIGELSDEMNLWIALLSCDLLRTNRQTDHKVLITSL